MKTFENIPKRERGLFFIDPFTYIASKEKEFFVRDFFNLTENNLDFTNELKNNNVINDNISLPLFIFNNGLSGLEAISKYLKEISNLRFCDIAKLLNRDDRTIWDAYNNAKHKSGDDFSNGASNIHIPLEIFNNRSLSILETLTSYLKEEFNLRYCQIANLLNKDARTVWTVYSRANKKRKNVANN